MVMNGSTLCKKMASLIFLIFSNISLKQTTKNIQKTLQKTNALELLFSHKSSPIINIYVPYSTGYGSFCLCSRQSASPLLFHLYWRIDACPNNLPRPFSYQSKGCLQKGSRMNLLNTLPLAVMTCCTEYCALVFKMVRSASSANVLIL